MSTTTAWRPGRPLTISRMAIPEGTGVGEEERPGEAQHGDALDPGRIRPTLEVREVGRSRNPAQLHDLRQGRPTKDVERGQQDGDGHPGQRSVGQHAEQRGSGDKPLAGPPSVEGRDGSDVDESEGRHEDDRGQRWHRQVGHRPRQEEQHREHRARRDQAGQLGPRASRLGGARPRRAGADRVAADQAADQICAGEGHQLTVRIGLFAVLLAEGTAGGGGVGKAQERQPDGARQEREDLVHGQGWDERPAGSRPAPDPGPGRRAPGAEACSWR